MHDTQPASHVDTPRTSRLRIGLAWFLGAVAVLLTLYFGLVIFDAATNDYVGGEVDLLRAVLGATALFASLAWIGAVALMKSGHDRSRHSRLLNTGLWITLGGAVATQALGGTPLWPGGLGVVAIGVALAAVGAARM